MKIKVEKKDLIIFIIFCVFLLYLCAIGVLNVSSLASNSKFYGFLPFKASAGVKGLRYHASP